MCNRVPRPCRSREGARRQPGSSLRPIRWRTVPHLIFMRTHEEPAAPPQSAAPLKTNSRFRRWIVVVALLAGGYFAGMAALNRYLASTGFRSKMGRKLAQELNGNAG